MTPRVKNVICYESTYVILCVVIQMLETFPFSKKMKALFMMNLLASVLFTNLSNSLAIDGKD
jgi:hypothetical protein